MSKYKGVKKTLAVFMAALMVMSCWVFTPISFEAEAATDNTSLLNGLSKDSFDTAVTTVYGSFGADSDYLEDTYYNNVYHNVLYTDGTVSSATATSAKTEYGSNGTGSNGVTIYWYHPQATLMYDGNKDNLPRLGVAINTVMYYSGLWSRKSVNRLSWVSSGGNGFEFNTNWRGSDSRLNFQYMWNGCEELMGYTSTVVSDSLKQTVESDSKDHMYANLLKFTGTMDNNEYVRTVTPTFSFYGDNGSSAKTISATTTKSITIINYVPLKNALTAALAEYTKAAANLNYYTTASVTKFAELAKALIAAKPNNYVNSTKNDYAGYATAAKAAVDAWNAWSGLEVRYITFKLNLNGGTTTAATEYKKTYGETFGNIPTPIREGYTFNGFYLDNGTQLTTSTRFEDDLTWTAKWTINQYTAKFQYRSKATGETLTYSTNSYVNYGSNVNVPKANMPNYGDDFTIGDNHYTLTGWTLDGNAVTFPTTMPAKDPTYVAVYNEEFLKADLTTLKEQIARADEMKKNDYYTQKGYTDEYILALDTAYTNAAALNKDTTGKSQQEAVNTAANSLKTILDSPKVKDVTVIFKDETGSVLKDGYATVKWGESVTVPENPSIANDIENHYYFKGWVGTTDNEVKSFCAKVTEDRIFLADFDAEAHSWKEETITSTCTSDGAIRHTCTKCGYTYDSANDDKAHHSWTAEKVVVKAATCHSEGIKATQCTECKVYQEGSIESIAKLEHSYGEWTDYVEATCTGKGVQVRTCKNDGCEAKEYQKTAAKEHDWDSKTVVNPTCAAAGYTRETCKNCGLIRYTAGAAATGHTTTTETVAATCTADGYIRTYCTKCKAEIGDRTTLKKSGHSFGEWTDIVTATCGQTGVQYHECSACKQIEYRTVEKLTDHSYEDVVTAPTCTAQGYTTHTCTVCGGSYVDTYIDVLSHNMENVAEESQAATCMTPSITVDKCSRCDYKTVTVGSDTKGHDFQEVADKSQAATCGQSGYRTMECSGCGLEYKEYTDNATGKHDWKYETKQEGTTLTVTATCEVCGAKAETTATVAEGHNYSQAEITKQPTCIATGTMKVYCDKEHDATCTAYIEAEIDKNSKAHAGETTTSTTPATCTASGTVVTTCSDCNAKIAETTIPATGHSYAEYVKDEVVATCTTKGKIVLKCTNNDCGSETTIETSTNPNAHKYEKTSSVPATCTTSAYDVYTCKNGCGATYNVYTGDALDHDWSEAVVQQNGNLITVTRTCKRDGCKETETVLTNKEIDNRHDYSGKVETVTAATCKTEGKIKVYCKDEGCDSYVEINIGTNAKAHTLKTEYKAPDCLSDGYVKTYCTECTNELSNQKIDKLGHDFSVAGDITTSASCTADGKQTYKCSRCDETTEVVIPKLGHDYEITETHNATCTTYGYYVKKCKTCGDTYNELIKESGHKLTGEVETVAPTCTEQGYDKQLCETCGEWIKSNYVNAIGHNFDGKGTVVTPPTCKAGGYTTYTCQNEGCTYSYVGDYTPTSSHDYTGENSVVVTPPTCTSKGYTTHTCKNCDYYFIDTYVDAIGHDFDMTKGEAGVDAETGKNYTKYPCKHECGEYQYEYVGDGCSHANWEYVKTVDPTCTQDGYDIYSCPTCKDDAIKTNIKPALGHNWDYWTIITYPTETSNGLQVRKCKNCTAEETEEIVYGKYYLVTFYNHDGTRLIRPAYYSYGKAAKMPDFTPTRVADAGYTYTFKGYNYTKGEINCVTKRMAVIAEYEAHERSYAVTYQNEDGTVLQTVSNVKYTNITSAYTAATPTKASDEYYTYTFSSWSVNYNTENGTAVATATYTQKLTNENVTPDGDKPGIFTKLIEWFKAFIKKLFGIG